jgi:hypothetical protein
MERGHYNGEFNHASPTLEKTLCQKLKKTIDLELTPRSRVVIES